MVTDEIVTTDDLNLYQNLGKRKKAEKPRRTTGPTRAASQGQLSFMQSLVAQKCGGDIGEVDISLWDDMSVAEASGVIESLIKGNKKSTIKNPSGPPASDKQVNFIKSLIEQKGATDIEVEGISKADASKAIEDLLARPNAPVKAEDQIDVPAGRYAIDSEDGHTSFYHVDRPEHGKWAGFTFVKLQVGGSVQRLSQKMGKAILKRIEEAGPKEASIRYGMELGVCGVCGRDLTNEESRKAGIGPICANKF